MKIQQVSTGGFIVRNDGKFLIMKRSMNDDFLPGYWEIPGGGSDYGETAQEAIKREIREETGLDVEIRVPLFVGGYMMGEKQRIEINFLCNLKDTKQEPVVSGEHEDTAWISPDEIEKYQMTDYMKDVINQSSENLDFWIKKYLS